MNEQPRVRVMQATDCWLPQTQAWLHHQVRCLPEWVESHVVCQSTQNLDQYPVALLHSYVEQPPWRRRYWYGGLRRLGRPHQFAVDCARRARVRVLHSHFGNIGWEYLPVARRAGLKHVVTFYGFDVGQLPQRDPAWRRRYKQLFAEVDRVLCEGPHMAECIITELGCPREKIQVQHLGVDVDQIAFRPRRWAPGEPLRVLIASTFTEKKGIPYGLQALSLIARDVELQITILGDSGTNPQRIAEKEKILRTLEKTGLQSRTRLLGYQPYATLFEEAYRHHVFLVPSVRAIDGDTEGGAPVSLIDMASTGMPIVSTRHCDIPNVVLDGKTGLLAEERDPEGLAALLRKLLESPESWESMVTLGRRRMEQEFGAPVQGQRLAGVYQSLVGGA
ncbi:MAG TPA: glycosyltransferase [Armatimonadota bacterium]